MSSPGLLAIIVVYKQDPAACSSLRTLLAANAACPGQRLTMLVADNTPGGQGSVSPGGLPTDVAYRAYPHNPGLATPYNDALAAAEQQGCEWMLTLDQDTSLPDSFLCDLQAQIALYTGAPRVAAIVPRISDGGRLISPFRFRGGWLPAVLPPGASGILPRHASALNSASTLRVSTLRRLGGYNPRYPLHNSDTCLYRALDLAGERVAVADGIHVAHELAILDRGERMSAERYRQTLVDECSFWDRNMGPAARCERLVRLAGRAVKGLLRGEDRVFRAITLAELKRRLVTSRKTRLAEAERREAEPQDSNAVQ